jgi:hypothetical protein
MFTSTIVVCRLRRINITMRVKGEIGSMLPLEIGTENRHGEFLTAAIVRVPEAAR